MFGFIMDILTLNADVRVAEALDLMVQILLNHIVPLRKEGDSVVFINAVESDGPDLELASIESTIENVFDQYRPRKELSYECCLKQVEMECYKPDRKIFYGDLTESQSIAQNFQVF